MPYFDNFEIEAIKRSDNLLTQLHVCVVHSVDFSLVCLVLAKCPRCFFYQYNCWIDWMSFWIGVFYEWTARQRFIGFRLNDEANQPKVTLPMSGEIEAAFDFN